MMLIKMVFTFLYLISNLYLATCLMCTNCTDITLSFTDATKFPAKCEGKFVEADICQAVLHMDYLTKEIKLNFTAGSGPIGNSHTTLTVENKFDEPKIKDLNITYTCKTTGDCAKLFYQPTIQTLIKNEPILDEIRSELFDPTVLNVQQCSNSQNQAITCQNGYGCHGYEILENGKTSYVGECRNASTITIFPRLYFAITLVQSDPPTTSDWNHLGYTCNKQSLCNTQQQVQKMIKLANNFYPWELHQTEFKHKILSI